MVQLRHINADVFRVHVRFRELIGLSIYGLSDVLTPRPRRFNLSRS